MRTKNLATLFLISVMAPAAMLWGQNTYVPDNNFDQALIGFTVAGGGAAVAFSGVSEIGDPSQPFLPCHD